MSRYNDTSRPAPGGDAEPDGSDSSTYLQHHHDLEMAEGKAQYAHRRYFCESCGNHHTGIVNSGPRYCPPEPTTNKAHETRC